MASWTKIQDEMAASFRGEGRFPIRAYSEFMPPPWILAKPTEDRIAAPRDLILPITEYEEQQELRPGLGNIARHLIGELLKLNLGTSRAFSRTLLRDNPAWTPALAAAAKSLSHEDCTIVLPVALSRTQDWLGNVRWTLFGASHDGPERSFWLDYSGRGGRAEFARFVAWAIGSAPSELEDLRAAGVRVLARVAGDEPSPWSAVELPGFARELRWSDDEPLENARVLVTFRPFARLPEKAQQAYLAGKLRLLPCPSSLIFFDHAGYRKLARDLPHAEQVPLLHLFPRSESSFGLRIPQSGWLDELPPADLKSVDGHRPARGVRRAHRWQKIERGDTVADEGFDDHITIALFSTDPDHLGLYGKPMARNAQIWTEAYERLLDGPRADRDDIAAAARAVRAGGRFGYRFLFPPMRIGPRAVFWHRPLIARFDRAREQVVTFDGPLGFLTAELPGEPPIVLEPRLVERDGHREAARVADQVPGYRRLTTSMNARSILEARDLLGFDPPPSFVRALVHASKETSLDAWLASLPSRGPETGDREKLSTLLRSRIGPERPFELGPDSVPASLTFGRTRAREFEECYWWTIAQLSEGKFRDKECADVVLVNDGKTGGERASKLGWCAPAKQRDLDALADHLHATYARLIEKHSMTGRAFTADHWFRWETDFDFAWSLAWKRNQTGESRERNVFLVIPGRDRSQAVIMADHYDTAYMDDLYDPHHGGDRLRVAAEGADDNASATAALLGAADVLLPLAREGKLARDVWLVHLTGEEFPADCLGARALCQRLVQRDLAIENGRKRVDLSHVKVRGAFVLDMIAHNHERDRDVFQIAPGEGRESYRLAWRAHLANARWNDSVAVWNKSPERRGRGRARRMESGATVPPIAEHLALLGEVRPEWDPRSTLFNTDGQIFSDVGVPVVLFMENYDIRRQGYHDTRDTMENIDLDYGAALAAIAIETVADCATADEI